MSVDTEKDYTKFRCLRIGKWSVNGEMKETMGKTIWTWIKKHKKQVGLWGGIILIVVPFIVYGLSEISFLPVTGGNDWAGFWGGYIGAIIGAGVAAWGIIFSIKNERHMSLAPYFIFEEVEEPPENEMIIGHFLNCGKGRYQEKIVSIENVGSGPAVNIVIESSGRWNVKIPVIKKESKKYISFEYNIEIPSEKFEGNIEEYEHFLEQSKEMIAMISYEDLLGKQYTYELVLEYQCVYDMIGKRPQVNTYLKMWKLKK